MGGTGQRRPGPVGPYPYPPAPPYGQAGPYGYQYDGRPAVEGTNGLAITALVTGLTCCLWPAALGFGIAALVQLRRRRQRGRGLAIAGVVLGMLGLVFGAVNAVNGNLHFHSGSTSATTSMPALPPPGDTPETPGNPTDLAQSQQVFLQDLAELEVQDSILQIPVTDPGMAVESSESVAQALTDTAETLKQTQWPAGVQGPISTLVNSLEADATVWNAVRTSADPVSAFQAAVRTSAPAIAEAVARQALSLPGEDQPGDPDSDQPSDTPLPEDSAAPAAV